MGQASQNGQIGGSSSNGGDKSKPEESKQSSNEILEQGDENNVSSSSPNRINQPKVPKLSKSKPPANVHGFGNEELHLQKLLSNRGTDDQFRAIGVVGIAGVGKTTLCQRIFHNPDVKTQFVPRIWVCTLSGQETPESIVKRMLKRLGVDDDTTNSFPEGQGLAFLDYVLQQQLIGKRYLIVLDDFEDMEVCKHLSKVMPTGYGGRLIITSRNKKLTKEMVGKENLHQLQPLSDQESCWLIYRDSVRDKDAELKSQARIGLEKKLEKLQGQNESDAKLIEEKKSIYKDAVNFPSSKQLKEELEKILAQNTKMINEKGAIPQDSANLPNSKQLEEVEKLQGQITKMIDEKRAKHREQRKNAEELKRKCGGLPLAAKLLGEIKAQEERPRKEELLKDILYKIERVIAANKQPEAETQEQDAQTPPTEGESNSAEPTAGIVNA